jgi:hypothetical protein
MRRPARDHTPQQNIRMSRTRWRRLGEVYGDRARSKLFNDFAAYMLREPGARCPRRADQDDVAHAS